MKMGDFQLMVEGLHKPFFLKISKTVPSFIYHSMKDF